MCFAQRRTLFEHLNFQKWSEHGVLCTFWLRNMLPATTACTFFNISTSKSAPNVRCFDLFHLQMCFAPQQHALFRHLTFQKCSEPGVCVLYILTSTCSLRHNGVQFQFLIWPHGSAPAALASLYFSTLLSHKSLEKTLCFATFWPFRAPASSFFWLFLFFDLLSSSLLFFSLTLPISAFHLSILSEVWLLNFLRWSLCCLAVLPSLRGPDFGSVPLQLSAWRRPEKRSWVGSGMKSPNDSLPLGQLRIITIDCGKTM